MSGERQIDEQKWRRFFREFAVPFDSDTNEIGAKFERGTLYIKFPKLITPSKPQPEVAEAPKTPPPPPPPPPPTRKAAQEESPPSRPTREEEKAEEAIKKKPETSKDQPKGAGYNGVSQTVLEQKEKEQPSDKKGVSEGNEGKDLILYTLNNML